jgi:hypothetical protein
MLMRRTMSMYRLLADGAVKAVQPWARLWREGHGAAWLADARYIEEETAGWTRALL